MKFDFSWKILASFSLVHCFLPINKHWKIRKALVFWFFQEYEKRALGWNGSNIWLTIFTWWQIYQEFLIFALMPLELLFTRDNKFMQNNLKNSSGNQIGWGSFVVLRAHSLVVSDLCSETKGSRLKSNY